MIRHQTPRCELRNVSYENGRFENVGCERHNVRCENAKLIMYHMTLRPHPSLSFGEYNSSSRRFFTPLAFFWRGIIWTPEMRGKGVPKMIFFLVYFCCAWVSEWAPKNWFQYFIIFGLNFGFLFFGILDFLGAFWEPSSAS